VFVLGLALSTTALTPGARAQDRDEDLDGQAKDKEKTVRIYRSPDGETADLRGGYLGVQVQDITRSLRRARNLTTDEGALVNRVEDESPADVAGIRRGDVIVEVGGERIEDSAALIEVVRGLKPGKEVEVELIRGGERKRVTVEVGKRPKDQVMNVPGLPRWRDSEGAWSVPVPPPTGFQRERLEGLSETLRDLQEQLRTLRDTELPRLEQEIRMLREELRRVDDLDEEGRSQIRREGRRSRTPAED
jgi:membrane-associated protease RseP (regulator of RpoE activity)